MSNVTNVLLSHSVLSDSVTLWTVTCQAPQSMGFPRQEYWSGLPFPTPGDLPNSGIQPVCLHLLHWQAGHSCINWGFSSLLVPDVNFAPQASMGKKTLSLRILEILHPPQQCSHGSYSEHSLDSSLYLRGSFSSPGSFLLPIPPEPALLREAPEAVQLTAVQPGNRNFSSQLRAWPGPHGWKGRELLGAGAGGGLPSPPGLAQCWWNLSILSSQVGGSWGVPWPGRSRTPRGSLRAPRFLPVVPASAVH